LALKELLEAAISSGAEEMKSDRDFIALFSLFQSHRNPVKKKQANYRHKKTSVGRKRQPTIEFQAQSSNLPLRAKSSFGQLVKGSGTSQ
jgi:hypothetical protein